MAFKPNYRFERSERNRLKLAKKDEKLRRQQERKAQRDEPKPPEADGRSSSTTGTALWAPGSTTRRSRSTTCGCAVP
jgi:hypothetical protein